MSVRHYGRITPLQGDMLSLGGVVLHLPDDSPDDAERMACMREARAVLRRQTGLDFGYDLRRWHEHLLQSDDHRKEYTFSYAWRGVGKKIESLLEDRDRLRLAELLEGEEGAASGPPDC